MASYCKSEGLHHQSHRPTHRLAYLFTIGHFYLCLGSSVTIDLSTHRWDLGNLALEGEATIQNLHRGRSRGASKCNAWCIERTEVPESSTVLLNLWLKVATSTLAVGEEATMQRGCAFQHCLLTPVAEIPKNTGKKHYIRTMGRPMVGVSDSMGIATVITKAEESFHTRAPSAGFTGTPSVARSRALEALPSHERLPPA